MDFKFFKDARVLSFIGGAAAVVCAQKVIASQQAHDACVASVAKGMRIYKDAKAAAVNIKEEAEDICEEAKATIDKEDEAGETTDKEDK